jgi:hydrogenase-4 membrane subunit HyfE
MTGVLIGFVIVVLVPLFVATWRTSLLGLSMQGGLMAWLALRHHATLSLPTAALVVDLIVLRTLLAPLLLHQVMSGRGAAPRNDVIAPNLFSWALVITLVVVAFRAADALVPVEGDEQMLVAVASSAFVLGLFVLATARGTFSQVIGVLRIENSIALFELGSREHDEIDAVRIGMSVILFVSILFYRWYVETVFPEAASPATSDSPAL